jgi:hemolysin activation/secretion protein
MSRYYCHARLLLLLLLMAAVPAAHAQVDAQIRRRAEQEAEQQQQRQQLQEQSEQRQGRQDAATVRLPDASGGIVSDSSLPEETPCFTFTQFALDLPSQLTPAQQRHGASSLPQDPFHFLLEAMEHYRGRCIGSAGIKLIHHNLTALLIARGYSTSRLGIPEQDLSSGTFVLALIPGVIGTISFASEDVAASWRTAFPVGPGDLLNLRELEQGLEQLKRIPSHDVEMQIVPGSSPGNSDIVITVRRSKPWKISLSLDDSGSKSTGSLQTGINLALDSPLGLNDLFNLGFSSDVEHQGSQRGTNGNKLNYSLPYGNWTFGLAASSYDYHQKIAGLYETFVSSGKGRNLEIKFSRLFQRSQEQKNSLYFKLGKRWNRAYINDTEIGVQRRNATHVELGWIHKHYFGAAQLDLSLANRWGAGWLNGDADFSNRQSGRATRRYTLQTLDASLYVPFQLAGQALSYSGTLHAQMAQTALYASEQLSLGNRYTVRGFDGELSLSAERGFFLRNEISLPWGDRRQSVYVGLDGGKVFGPSVKNLLGDSLAGAAVGLRGVWQGLHYDLFLSRALYKPAQFRTSSTVAGFSLVYQY